MTKIMDAIKADKPMAYILLTLTVRNCLPPDLDDTLDGMMLAFKLLTKSKDYKSVSHGYYRSLEVTHNLKEDTYHPHLHVIVAVNPSYFTSRDYIKQARWTEIWQRSIKANYVPVVDVRKVKGDSAGAVAEVAKYASKDGDYIIPDDWDLTVETVRLLDAVFANRRFLGYGGIFREYHKKLNLDNPDDGDLIHVEAEEPTAAENEKLVHFAWFSGYRQYMCEGD
jgi:plasmid rolling circle replication initiator protein Rep